MPATSCIEEALSGKGLEKARAQHGLPSGGAWFWTQNPALACAQRSSGIAVAWDKAEVDTARKIYGCFPSAEDLYASLLQLPEGGRHAYEIIRESVPCRNYADIEWVGDRDSTHNKLRALVAELRAYCEAEYGRAIKLYVSCSTRAKDEKAGLWKNSYHLVFENLVFQNNHGGAMKAFWAAVCKRLSGGEWHWDSQGKETHIIDMAVYTRNRCMRLMLCSKRGGGVPFRRISGDPSDENDDLTSTYDENDPAAWKPFFVSCPDTSCADAQATDDMDSRVIMLAGTPQESNTSSENSSKRRTQKGTAREGGQVKQAKQAKQAKQVNRRLCLPRTCATFDNGHPVSCVE